MLSVRVRGRDKKLREVRKVGGSASISQYTWKLTAGAAIITKMMAPCSQYSYTVSDTSNIRIPQMICNWHICELPIIGGPSLSSLHDGFSCTGSILGAPGSWKLSYVTSVLDLVTCLNLLRALC